MIQQFFEIPQEAETKTANQLVLKLVISHQKNDKIVSS